jgi:hypothetical protein
VNPHKYRRRGKRRSRKKEKRKRKEKREKEKIVEDWLRAVRTRRSQTEERKHSERESTIAGIKLREGSEEGKSHGPIQRLVLPDSQNGNITKVDLMPVPTVDLPRYSQLHCLIVSGCVVQKFGLGFYLENSTESTGDGSHVQFGSGYHFYSYFDWCISTAKVDVKALVPISHFHMYVRT